MAQVVIQKQRLLLSIKCQIFSKNKSPSLMKEVIGNNLTGVNFHLGAESYSLNLQERQKKDVSNLSELSALVLVQCIKQIFCCLTQNINFTMQQSRENNKKVQFLNVSKQIFPDQQRIYIDLQDWILIGKGMSHIVIGHKYYLQAYPNDDLDKISFEQILKYCVLRIQLELDTKSSNINDKNDEIYRKFIRNACKKQYILKSDYLSFINDKDKTKFQNFLNTTNKKCSQISGCQISYNLLSSFKIEQMKLFKYVKWTVIMQIKPKSPLPTIFHAEELQLICSQMGIAQEKIKQTVEKSPILQKTRYFRKQLMEKKSNPNKKSHLNPFTCYFPQNQQQRQFVKTKGLKRFLMENGNYSEKSQDCFVSEKIINIKFGDILNKSGALEEILHMQQMKTSSLWACREDFQIDTVQLKQVQKSLQKQYERVSKLNLQDFFRNWIDKRQVLKSQLYFQKLLFLISQTWKDVSIILRIKLTNQNNIEDYDLKIIDWELKKLSKISQTIEKQRNCFQHYIQWKLKEKL